MTLEGVKRKLYKNRKAGFLAVSSINCVHVGGEEKLEERKGPPQIYIDIER